jgi:hypothetical protein
MKPPQAVFPARSKLDRMDTYDSTRDTTATGPRPRDFKNALRENEADAALQSARVDDLRREDTLRTYETTAPATLSSTPSTYSDVGVAGGTYEPAATTRAATPVAPGGVTSERRVDNYPAREGPFSIIAGFLGWAVAAFFTFVLLAIILGVLGTAAYDSTTATGNAVAISQAALNDLTWTGIIGGLVAVFVGYFLGGYNAGRIDRYHGVGQGVAVVAWTILAGIVAAILAGVAADTLNLGYYLAPYNIDWNAITTQGIIGLVLTLGVMLGAAILGGLAGERYFHRADVAEERRDYRARSRPRV